MKIFFEYLLSHKKSITLWAVFSAVFALIFWLYKLPAAAVFYSVLICFFIGTVCIAVDFSGLQRKAAYSEKTVGRNYFDGG